MNKEIVKWFNTKRALASFSLPMAAINEFVHISAVERAAMSTLNEGQNVCFGIVADRRSGKSAIENLCAV